MKKRTLILVGTVVLLINGSIWAEETKYNLGEVIVSATKTESYQAEVGSFTTVITGDNLRKTGKATVLEALRAVSGVAVMESGDFGGKTYLFLRGSNPGHTLVLIDGVEANDPREIERSFDFAHLMTENIERIEIVKGPQSTLYGSDAMGGVINIITKKGKGAPKFELTCEGGSHNTFKENLSLSGGTERTDYFLSFLRLESEGISKGKDGSEKDGYQNFTYSCRLGQKVFDDAKLNLSLRYTDTENDLDGSAYNDDPNYTAWKENLVTRFSFEQAPNSWWDYDLSFSYNDVRRKYRDEKDHIDTTEDKQYWYKGDNKKFEWQNNFSISDWDIITCGFEYEEERGSSCTRSGTTITKVDRRTVDNKGLYLQNHLTLWERLFATLGVRVDRQRAFGTEATYKTSCAYIIRKTQTHFKANWGTGFKAPTIFHLYSNYGSPDLNPEESKSYDFGFEQNFLDNKIFIGASYFHNRFNNMIDYDWGTSKYENIGKAETKGSELELTFKPTENLAIGTNYTYTEAKDKDEGTWLRRRPKHQVGLNINLAFLEKGNVSLSADYIGSRWDDDRPANTKETKQYIKADLFGSYELSDTFQIFGKIENLFDREFMQIRGFAAPGISFYGGCRATF